MTDAVRHPAKHVGASFDARPDGDFYETRSTAVWPLLQLEQLPNPIWEPACGRGAISEVLKAAGHRVVSSDLFDRGYGRVGVDFYQQRKMLARSRSIVTNPPYKAISAEGDLGVERWIRHGWDLGAEKMVLLMRTLALAGKERSAVHQACQLARVYQFTGRLTMLRGGSQVTDNMIDYAWFVYERGHVGPPTIHWIEEGEGE